jgi:hypothetical protein
LGAVKVNYLECVGEGRRERKMEKMVDFDDGGMSHNFI